MAQPDAEVELVPSKCEFAWGEVDSSWARPLGLPRLAAQVPRPVSFAIPMRAAEATVCNRSCAGNDDGRCATCITSASQRPAPQECGLMPHHRDIDGLITMNYA